MSASELMRLVGLRYAPEHGLPEMILKASGPAAEEALRARQRLPHAPQVIRNPALLEQLYRLPVDARIGPELYRVVAIVLAHVLAVEASLRERADA